MPADLPVADLPPARFLHEHHLGFPVTDQAGNVLGLVTLEDAQEKTPGCP